MPKIRASRGNPLTFLLISVLVSLSISCRVSQEEGVAAPDTTEPDSSVVGTSAPESTTAEEPPSNSEELRSRYEEEIAKLIKTTEKIRGLQFLEQPRILLLDKESYRQRIAEIVIEEYSDLEAVDALYTLLGLLKPEDSLEDYYRDIFSRSVSAYYDSETREVVVPIGGSGLDLIERSSMIHELVHALTDQHFDFGSVYNALDENYKYDQSFALQALVEGDAIQSERAYTIVEMTPEEQSELSAFEEPADPESAPTLPYFLEGSFAFPYTAGGWFVNALLDENELVIDDEGYSLGESFYRAVNAAYGDPPVSTEQIYQPDKYSEELPLEIEHPVPEIPGYELDHTSTWGMLWFSLMFDQFFEPEEKEINGREVLVNGTDRLAVEGWGADMYSYWFNGTEAAFALSYRGDEASDASELFGSLQKYVSTAMNVEVSATGDPEAAGDNLTWQGEDFAWLSLSGDMLRFVAASDPEVGGLLVSTYQDF